VEIARRPADACRVRRSHIVLVRARGLSPKPLAARVGCAVQTVGNVIHAFNAQEVWGSRLAQPNLPPWIAAQPRRGRQNAPDRHDLEPKAVACSGRLRTATPGLLLRCVDGPPGSIVTTQVLAWLTDRLAAAGTTALWMVWAHASWHVRAAVRAWLKAHTRRVKREGGWRTVVCPIPSKRPWLNRLEPTWVHGQRAMADPARKSQVDELKPRLGPSDDCE
jgi:hypothetical protein